MHPVQIVIVDPEEITTLEKRVRVAHAITLQVDRHFSLPPPHGYGIGCVVRAATPADPPLPFEWTLALLRDPDVNGALGYHAESARGHPRMKVFPLLDADDGESWSVTASHEILETLADPNISRAAQASDGRFWAYEVCDAVEAYNYCILGEGVDDVRLSDFVLPAYFEPPDTLDGARFDHLGHATRPYEIMPGGYGQYWREGWQLIVHDSVLPRAYRTRRGTRRR